MAFDRKTWDVMGHQPLYTSQRMNHTDWHLDRVAFHARRHYDGSPLATCQDAAVLSSLDDL
jgi:hypothetical protein